MFIWYSSNGLSNFIHGLDYLQKKWFLLAFNPSTHIFLIKNFILILWFTFLPEQVTPASCLWVQLCFPQPSCLQFQMADSFPLQETWSIQMRPVPAVELAHPVAVMAVGHPSCLQITETSSMPQSLLHTVPHSSWTLISTLPLHAFSPAVSLSCFSASPATMG